MVLVFPFLTAVLLAQDPFRRSWELWPFMSAKPSSPARGASKRATVDYVVLACT